jgi:hypothetical protein
MINIAPLPTTRVSIALLDRSLTVPELSALERARGGPRLVVRLEPNCRRSRADMTNRSKRLHSVRGFDPPRVPAAPLSERIRIGGRS